MARESNHHVPTMVVVGLGMVLIAGLAGLAAWAWAHRKREPAALLGGKKKPAPASPQVAEA